MTPGLEVVWGRRERPLEASAVLAQGHVVHNLAVATAQRIAAGADLRVSASPGWMLVLAASTDLPWADGATYLGWEDGCLLPTTRTCRPRAALVAAAIGGDRVDDRIVVLLPEIALIAASPRQRPASHQVTPLR